MTIRLPTDLESRIQAMVQAGRFASIDDAMAEAVRLLLLQIEQETQAKQEANAGLGSIGALRDDAELLDRAVEHAMSVREQWPWRAAAGQE